MRRRAAPADPGSGTRRRLARQRHRHGMRHQILPAADPEPRLAGGVLAARRRADAAQLRVDVRAVEALVVVLDDQLPVRLQLVARAWRRRPAARARSRQHARRGRPGTPTSGGASPDALTNTQPCHSSTATGISPCSDLSKPSGHRTGASSAVSRRVRSASRGTGSGSSGLGSSPRTAPARGRGAGTRCRSRAGARHRRGRAARRRRRRSPPAGSRARRGPPRDRRTPTLRRTGASAPTPARRRRGRPPAGSMHPDPSGSSTGASAAGSIGADSEETWLRSALPTVVRIFTSASVGGAGRRGCGGCRGGRGCRSRRRRRGSPTSTGRGRGSAW